MKPAVAAAILLSLVGAGRPLGAAAPWVRVETPNFVVYGDAGGARVRDVAQEFERFREALGRVIPGTGMTAAVPTVVVLFSSERAFQPYLPKYNGKPVTLDGYFLSRDDLNIVGLVDGERTEALRRIFHEYVHLAIDNVMPGLPLWLNEGLAEFYSTFTVQDNGRRALVGGLIPAHLQLLSQRTLLPIDDLLAVEKESADYNEGDRRSIFYAQSWAIVHMLASGASNRSADLARYARLTAGGTPSRDAWHQVFGGESIIRSLDRYLAQSVMNGVVYRFEAEIPKVAADVSAVTASDAQAALADLLRHVASDGETTAAFERAVAQQPASARARALFGLHAIDLDRYEQGRQLLLAAADSPDWLVQYHVATGLTRLALETTEPDAELAASAKRALARVRAARPDLPHALMMSARLDGSTGGDDAEALATIRRARALAPGRADYALVESYILTHRGEYTAARELLTPLTGPRFSVSIRGAASRLIAEIATLEQDLSDYLARLEGRRPATAAPSAVSDAALATVTSFRRLADGERRIEGMLERMDCSDDRIVLEVRAAGGLERFAAPSAGVELISYRPDLAGAISCGARKPPDRVYVTLRDDRGTLRVVAIEFLKD